MYIANFTSRNMPSANNLGIKAFRFPDLSSVFVRVSLYTGWPKKVSHYQVPSLNRIKNR